MTKALIILNDALYGTKRSYNGLRLAGSLAKRDGVEVRVFLTGDAVGCYETRLGVLRIEWLVREIQLQTGKDHE